MSHVEGNGVKTSKDAEPTILRIRRRKRDEHEALDALVIESPSRPAKKVKGIGNDAPSQNKGIFRFAETVAASTFTSEDSTRSLRDRITSLLLHPPRASSSPSSVRSSSRADFNDENTASPGGRTSKFSAPRVPHSQRQHEVERKQARYRIIEERRSASLAAVLAPPPKSALKPSSSAYRSSRPTAPPIVRSTKPSDVQSGAEGSSEKKFRILEAAIESESSDDDDVVAGGRQQRGKRAVDPVQKKLQAYTSARNRQLAVDKTRGQSRSAVAAGNGAAPDEEDEMMQNFNSMLQDYLSLNGPTLSTPSKSSSRSSPPQDESPPHPSLSDAPDLSSGDVDDSDSEYVYDVYYRDSAPPTISASSESSTSYATTGLILPTDTGDLIDMSRHSGFTRIGALTGLPDDELLMDERGLNSQSKKDRQAGQGGDSDSSGQGMTDDEDSNEEDFYRNDYPEGEGERSSDEQDDDEDDMDDSDEDEEDERY